MPEYYRWEYEYVPGAAQLTSPIIDQEIVEAISAGQSVQGDFPVDARFQMDPERPKDVMLADNMLSSGMSAPIVAPAVRDFLLQEGLHQLELLRVSVLDHMGRVAADDYSIVHPCRIVDCIDKQKSVFTWSRFDPDFMATVSLMILDPHQLSDDDLLIRPRHAEYRILVREDFAKRLLAQGFQGISMVPLNG